MTRPSRRQTISALLFAVAFTLLFRPAAFRDYRRISVIVHKGPLALAEKPQAFAFENPGPAGPGSWILFIKISGESPSPQKISSAVNGTATGEIELAGRRILKEFKLTVPGDLIRPGQNRVEVGPGPAEVRLERITAKNFIGYSKGWMSFIVLPKETPAGRGLSWPMTLALALALGILGLLRSGRRRGSAAGKYEAAAAILAGTILGGALLSPRVGGPRILFAARSLWVFVVFLQAPIVFGLLAAAVKKIRTRLSPYLPLLRTKELAARPWLGRSVGLALAAAALAFNVSFMKSVLKIHGGNYSGFLHIYPDTLEKFGRLYLPPRPRTLFPNSDFEAGTLENWTASGEAFRLQPVAHDAFPAAGGRAEINKQGKYWIGTYLKNAGAPQGDVPFGTLTSVGFTIAEDEIGFLIGGGRTNPARGLFRESVALEVEGRVVLEETGEDREYMRPVLWNVRPWVGRTARLVITDERSPENFFRHVNADGFRYSGTSPLLKSLTTTIQEYDGQYFFFLAFDPFLARYRRDPVKYRWFIDEPAYRSHRIGYPLLVRLVSLGRPRLYPAAMIWLLLAANFAAVYVLSRIMIYLGQSPLWALCYLLIPGFHLSLYFGLPEPLAAAFLLAGSYFYLKRKLVPAAILLAVSLLVRETGLLLVIAFAAVEWLKRRNLRGSFVVAGAILPLALWRGFVTLRLFPLYGWKTIWFGPGDFTLPFLGIVRLGREVLGGIYLYPDIAASALIYAALVTAIFAAAVILIRKPDAWSLGLLLFSVLAVSLNLEKIWLHVDNAARGTSEAFLFLTIASLAGPAGRKPWTKYVLAGFFVLVLVYDLLFARLRLHVLDGLLFR